MWRTAAVEVIERRRDGSSVHKAHGVCTAKLSVRVEDVGKGGWVKEGWAEISICPETHRHDLESSPLFNWREENELGESSTFPEASTETTVL